ncbi:MAG: DUF5011 domain-containing protein [Candidatus Parcubacteria bacterium]|nr:DUF5011 domain-containing protein [Candidatus Parcubacteria bacterium]
MSLLEKMRGNTGTWTKVSNLAAGVEIAVPGEGSQMQPQHLHWDEIVSITPVGREHVYDIEVEGTHNFVGNGIFAHNTYVLRANTMLAVEGEIHAEDFIVPIGSATGAWATSGTGTTTLMAEIPSAVLTADGKGVDLYKLSTYNLAGVQALAARMNDEEMRVTSLESRVEKLESGAVSSASGNVGIGSSTLASAFNAFGAFISNGIAQFGSLVADRFVAAANSAGTSSAGTVSMLTGNTVAEVTNAYVTPATKIFVTFNSSVTGSWYVSDKQAGSFRVVLSAAQTTDVSFDYFLVQTEGQIATSTPQIQTPDVLPSGSSGSSTGAAITLLGDNPLLLPVGGTFTDPGVVVGSGASYVTFIDGVQKELNTSTIDTSAPTTYIITYKASDSMASVVRSVIVGNPDGTVSSGGTTASTTPASSDKTAPVVTLNGSAAMNLVVGDTFTDPGATATDDTDGAITPVVTGTVDTTTTGSYTITYTATDAAKNTGTASRLVTVAAAAPDTTAPVVTLNGSATMSLTVGDTFTDAGATATDNVDGDLTSKIVKTGSVDTATAGSYTLTYSATDAAGNTGSASLTVTVAAPAQ